MPLILFECALGTFVSCLIKGLLLCLFAKVKSYQPNLKRITFLTVSKSKLSELLK